MLVIERHLSCNICGETYGIDHRDFTSELIRKGAKEEGWFHCGRVDWCPECKRKKKGEGRWQSS